MAAAAAAVAWQMRVCIKLTADSDNGSVGQMDQQMWMGLGHMCRGSISVIH